MSQMQLTIQVMCIKVALEGNSTALLKMEGDERQTPTGLVQCVIYLLLRNYLKYSDNVFFFSLPELKRLKKKKKLF